MASLDFMFRKISNLARTVKVSICDRLHAGSIYPATCMPANKRKKQGEFLPLLPRNWGFFSAADREKIKESPCHSHSIVSGTCKCLNYRDFSSGHPGLTVRNTVEKSRLKAIDGDRCRKQLPQVGGSHRIAQ